MSNRYVMCARPVSKGLFTTEPGKTLYLVVPPGVLPAPLHAVRREVWLKGLLEAAAYDWPSDDKALNYLEDRHDAKKTAMQLVSDGIHLFSKAQRPDCTINMHLVAHSTGAYLLREAFDDADDARLQNNAWMVSQIVFIGADVSAGSMSGGNATSSSLYRHCSRLANYSNLHDSVLKLTNAKRVGMAPRVGRVGMPEDLPSTAVNLDCTEYFAVLKADPVVRQRDQREEIGSFNHSWHIGNRDFAQDLFETLKGDADRNVVSSRYSGEGGTLHLKVPVAV